MNLTTRSIAPLFALCLLSIASIHCTRPNANPTGVKCGEGYTYTVEEGCVPSKFICDPVCTTDQRCVKDPSKEGDNGKCVARYPDNNNNNNGAGCAIICSDNEVCRDGKCVSVIDCSPACKQGETCLSGKCVRRKECNPPCPQFGYVCNNGICEKICVPECTGGAVCLNGVCQVPCKPACNASQFCDSGKCVSLVDNDKDGFKTDRDCDDKDKEVNPDAPEVCDGKDNDCDGKVDNIETSSCYTGPSGTLGRGACTAGVVSCVPDSNDPKKAKRICANEVLPSKETCDKIDNDCNGLIDDNCS